MRLETKSFGADISVKADTVEEGTFKGYASTFGNVDLDDDIIMRGAFGRDIRTKGQESVKLLWQHNRTEPIGVWTKLVEDEKGLYAEGRLALKTRRGAEAYELMKMGALNDMSVGFRTIDADYAKATQPGAEPRKVRRIKRVKLYEVSLVTIPANPLASVAQVKSLRERLGAVRGVNAELSERDIERRLRDGGLTRKQAATLIAEGLGGWCDGFEDVLRDAMGLTHKQAEVLLAEGFDGLLAHLQNVVKNATGVCCDGTQIIVESGYKKFVASRDDTEADQAEDRGRKVTAATKSAETVDLDALPDLVVEDATQKSAAEGQETPRDDGVHPRDADAEANASGSQQVINIEPEFFRTLVADLGNISGARDT